MFLQEAPGSFEIRKVHQIKYKRIITSPHPSHMFFFAVDVAVAVLAWRLFAHTHEVKLGAMWLKSPFHGKCATHGGSRHTLLSCWWGHNVQSLHQTIRNIKLFKDKQFKAQRGLLVFREDLSFGVHCNSWRVQGC